MSTFFSRLLARRAAVLLVFCLLAAAGAVAWSRLPVDAFPDVTNVQVMVLTKAPGDGAAVGGGEVTRADGWFAARPAGTEDVDKIYAESFRGTDRLRLLQEEARALVSEALAGS